MDKNEEYDVRRDLQCWFGLNRAAFAVLPRVGMELMPVEWQEKMALLLNEYDDTINQGAFGVGGCTVQARDGSGKLMKMPDELLNYRHPTPEAKVALLKGDDDA